ncbi:hypothetical protein CEXT_740801 [Caerostris extrusa]|uniref:Uncharacterized protein n=1 Tax=Caerostris extrusa TaxID=172846 RepID=A0AAV4PZ91_CAEEX|nr:hypothetical protein CEXT_740801 [Caerostris extrusa]
MTEDSAGDVTNVIILNKQLDKFFPKESQEGIPSDGMKYNGRWCFSVEQGLSIKCQQSFLFIFSPRISRKKICRVIVLSFRYGVSFEIRKENRVKRPRVFIEEGTLDVQARLPSIGFDGKC